VPAFQWLLVNFVSSGGQVILMPGQYPILVQSVNYKQAKIFRFYCSMFVFYFLEALT